MPLQQRSPSSIDPEWVIFEISRVITEITGVQLGDRQKTMVQSRLHKRILDLGLKGEIAYYEYFSKNEKTETNVLISLLTTHHTYFFREFVHFDQLEKKILPECIAAARAGGRKKLRIWSAACSRGQEVYSLSMFLALHMPRLAPDFTYEILGTDIDSESIAFAKNGVYPWNEIKEIPRPLLGDHWMRGTGDIEQFTKAKPSIKASCGFEIGNLLQITDKSFAQKFDIIFCRNVFIYFTPEQIQVVSRDLLKHLVPEGYLIVGISESLNGLDLAISHQGPSVYSHKRTLTAVPKLALPTASAPMAAPAPPLLASAPLRVLCVDDSPSIITLLKRILTKEAGFEVVATASNGIEAKKKLQEHKVDVITLDIHMPEQTGLEYLKANFSPTHPPVVMITSVSRDNSDLAVECLRSGALDYVEKPSLANFAERGEEIRIKLSCAAKVGIQAKRPAAVEEAFKSKQLIRNPEKKLRIIVASYSSWKAVASSLKELEGNQPPSIVFVEGAETMLQSFAKDLSVRYGKPVQVLDSAAEALEVDHIYLADFGRLFEAIRVKNTERRVSLVVFGGVSAHGALRLLSWKVAQLLIEDIGNSPTPGQAALNKHASDIVPATSFAYMSTEYLSKDNG